MPICIPNQLPAQDILTNENIFVMDDARASSQNIRPMEIGILNLMPNKIEAEVQLLRLLSNTPLQINVNLIRIDDTVSKHTPQSHMDTFYHKFSEIAEKQYDGLIITGAPLAHLPYEEVKYWDRMQAVMDWAKRHVQSTLFLCWATHAALYHFYGIQRSLRQTKLCGVFPHQVKDEHNELVRGFDPTFYAPHSRYGYIGVEQYNNISELKVLAEGDESGAHIIASQDKRLVFVTGHPEYDPDTLALEYERDIKAGLNPALPQNYFPMDDPLRDPVVTWRSHGSLLYTNWLNYYVYQTTPYDLTQLSKAEQSNHD